MLPKATEKKNVVKNVQAPEWESGDVVNWPSLKAWINCCGKGCSTYNHKENIWNTRTKHSTQARLIDRGVKSNIGSAHAQSECRVPPTFLQNINY